MVSFVTKSRELSAFGCIFSSFHLESHPCSLPIWFLVENVSGVRGGWE